MQMTGDRDRTLKWHRCEAKYLVTETQAAEIQRYCRDHLPADPHASLEAGYVYPIVSIYLDSASRLLLQHTVEKQSNRYKLRVRTYRDRNAPTNGLPEYFEIKRKIGGVVHTHSKYATAWAQAKKPLPCFGTTHADIFYGPVPCTSVMRDDQIHRDYEEETAVQILETFERFDYRQIPGVLVAGHGPFTWGQTPAKAVYHSLMLEYIAEMNIISLSLDPSLREIKQTLLDKHFLRKHGENAYYGQPEKDKE